MSIPEMENYSQSPRFIVTHTYKNNMNFPREDQINELNGPTHAWANFNHTSCPL